MSTEGEMPTRARTGLFAATRLLRYGVAGCASALAHVGTLTALVELAQVRPVWASNIGFAVSVVVSYALQRWWVFTSTARHRSTVPKFLVANCVALLLNTGIVAAGTEVFSIHYGVVQVAALVMIPLSNYLINSLWTFR